MMKRKTTVSKVSEPESERVIRFIETFCTLGGSFAGQPFLLEPFQKALIRDMYAETPDGERKHTEYLVGLPRKNGKSTLAAALALYHLYADPYDKQPLVVGAAGDREQARLVFAEAAKMVRNSPKLRKVSEVFKNVIRNKRNGGVYRVVSADAYTAQGLNPSFVVIDELHVFKTEDLITALQAGSAMRRSPMFLSISTAGSDLTSPLGRLYDRAMKAKSGEVPDDQLGCTWFGPGVNETLDLDDPKVWERFNPMWDQMPNAERAMRQQRRSLSQADFQRYKLNGWVRSLAVWFENGVFERLHNPELRLYDGDLIAIGFDGAWTKDSTALVACRISDFYLHPLGVWERPPGVRDWHTPLQEVRECARDAAKRYQVGLMYADPYRFQDVLTGMQEDGLPVAQFHTATPRKMIPATTRFEESVTYGELSHSGDPRLVRHVANCVIKSTTSGRWVTKDVKSGANKIDVAIAAILAHEAAKDYEAPSVEPIGGIEVISLAEEDEDS